MAAETIELMTEEVSTIELAAEHVAPVVELRPGMAATLAFVRWAERHREQGYGVCGIAEYRHNETGQLYIIDRGGDPLYLTD